MNKSYSTIIRSSGSYLPENLVTNEELSKTVDTNSQWIVSRTGITQRFLAAKDQHASDLAAKALNQALDNAKLKAEDLDIIIVATTTPDYTFPATAVIVQAKTGAKNAYAFDVQAVCAGFLYALDLADNYIKTGKAKRIAVIGTETMSRLLNWTDRTTCVLFGDGAGCLILEASEEQDRGIIDISLKSDGNYCSILHTTGGPGVNNAESLLLMKGGEVYKHAVEKMSSSVEELIAANNLSKDDIDWLIPHQANIRIIHAVGERLNFDPEKVIITVDKHANTSAATIPLAFDYAVQQNKFKKGDKIILTAIGGGLAWGSGLIVY